METTTKRARWAAKGRPVAEAMELDVVEVRLERTDVSFVEFCEAIARALHDEGGEL